MEAIKNAWGFVATKRRGNWKVRSFPAVSGLSQVDWPRRGTYRLARLAAKFGAEITLPDLVDRLSADCPARGPHNRGGIICGAHLTDTRGPTPPDLPPGMMWLRLLKGGKAA